MKFKLIITIVTNDRTDLVIERAREMGATGATVITSARGEGMKPAKTFFGLTLEGQVDIALFIVEEHLSREILEEIAKAGEFGMEKGSGVVMHHRHISDPPRTDFPSPRAGSGKRDLLRQRTFKPECDLKTELFIQCGVYHSPE